MIAAASDGPMPGSSSSCDAVAVLTSIGPAESEPDLSPAGTSPSTGT